jgi:hypothetical protein
VRDAQKPLAPAPANFVNGRGASEFPRTEREPIVFILVGAKQGEIAMAEHRKSASHGRVARKTTRKTARKTARRKAAPRRWSQRVTAQSDALDLKHGVFKLGDPKKIAASLKRSAQRSSRRKAGAYRSALSMLTFYINRAGKTLPKTQRTRLERTKIELRRQFGRE